MQTRKDIVMDKDGISVPVEVILCEACHGQAWYVWVIEGATHSHFQCILCGASYCPDGACP